MIKTTDTAVLAVRPQGRPSLGLIAAMAVVGVLALPGVATASPFGSSANLPAACDLAECDFTVDPNAEDQCFMPGIDSNQPTASFVISGDRVLAVNVPWGQDPGFDHAVYNNTRRVVIAAVSGNWEDVFSRCDRNLVAAAGRALGVYAWLTREEMDQVAPFLGYPGLPADLLPAVEAPVSEPPVEEPEVVPAADVAAAGTFRRVSATPTAVKQKRSGKARSGKARKASAKSAKAKGKRVPARQRGR